MTSTTGVATQELAQWLDANLNVAAFKDYCPNGLQVEGKTHITRIVTGVTASEALLQAAVERHADAVIVHHGWFWKNEDPRVRGPKRQRLQLALKHELNVFGFHLPLDAHPEWGNNAQLGLRLGLSPRWNADGKPQLCGPDNLVWLGHTSDGNTVQDIADRIRTTLKREPLVIGDPNARPTKVAWCTGGAQGFMTPPSMQAPTCTLQARPQSPTTTWPVKPASPSSPPATTPPSVTAYSPWGKPLRRNLTSRSNSSTWTTRFRPPVS